MKITWNRWAAAGLSVALAGGLLAGCSDSKPAQEAPKAGAKPFEGKNLTIVTANHPWSEAIKPLLPEFEASTGMKVTVQSFF